CYGSPYPNRYLEQMALHIQKQTGMKIVYLYGLPWQRFDKRIKHVFDAGPLEFLAWINNASLVLTTSFHCTIFSINFKRPFYSVYLNKEDGLRQMNILACLQMENRGRQLGDEFPSQSFFEIDFDAAHCRLDKMRADSHAYLKEMLSVGSGV
ncbi:MAG: polysaccharide pyruvyl transferase family protein, partial [Planctomycetales bacterium]|nr:polysaccharide pyruvyl transferase family protein [Planctomycetales bacterium]